MVKALEEPEASDLSPQCPLREIGASLSTKCVASRAQLVRQTREVVRYAAYGSVCSHAAAVRMQHMAERASIFAGSCFANQQLSRPLV
jgi:hypothetical protein